MTIENWLGQSNTLGIDIWKKKYRHNEEETFDQWIDRISGGDQEVKELILDKKFLFGGRILYGRGVKGLKSTYSNCYVIPAPEDNIESIFECAKRLARTYSYGGGCGTDLSKLRPDGAEVHNASKSSSGPVSFMDLFSQVTETISQAGRRGALMLSMDVRHPDVEKFIDCKTNLQKVQFANISIRVSDDFMNAAYEDKDYLLHWPCEMDISPAEMDAIRDYGVLHKVETQAGPVYLKKVRAKELFMKLARNNWDYAEPGILFWDNITGYNMMDTNPEFQYAGTNPCGELPLPPFGACLLGSLNLSEFVRNPFDTKMAYVDIDELKKAVTVAVRALNTVLDEGVSLHPLEEQRDCCRRWCQIGLGTMGMADMLMKLGFRYGSREANDTLNIIYHEIAVAAVHESLRLAKKDGCFPGCDKEALVNSSFIQQLMLNPDVIRSIRKYGLRNCQLLTCAPTGSIGTMLQTSTGIEPQFALQYTRRTTSLDGKDTLYNVNAKIVEDYIAITGNSELPEYFVTSAQITPEERVKTQGVIQHWIDNAISSTVNLPKEATVEQVADIYMNAWKHKLKGITVYRSGCKREGILVVNPEKPEDIPVTKAPKRPKELPADFYTVMSKGTQYIVLVGLFNDKPYEIFAFKPNVKLNEPAHRGTIIKKSKMHYSFVSDRVQINDLELANDNVEEKSATLYASMLLRHGVDIKYIVKTSKKVNDNITSFSSAMCRVLNKYVPVESGVEKCPECGGNIINQEGCKHCESCGWSRCD